MRNAAVATQELSFTIGDVINAENALAALLAEETGLVEGMQINKVGELQDRKLKLAALLERYTRYFSKNGHVLAGLSVQDRTALKTADAYLNTEMKKNYEKLLVARAVNQAVVTCVTGMFAKKAGNDLYNAKGAMYQSARDHGPMSMTLNKVI